MRSLLVFEILKFVTYGVILKISRLQGERELTLAERKCHPVNLQSVNPTHCGGWHDLD